LGRQQAQRREKYDDADIPEISWGSWGVRKNLPNPSSLHSLVS